MVLSVIILICRHDAEGVIKTLESIRKLNAEIIIYDTCHTPRLQETARVYQSQYQEGPWEGYERVRCKAAMLASHPWILMLHTGEELDNLLQQSLLTFNSCSRPMAYRIRFKNLLGHQWLNHGSWGGYYHIRLANRDTVFLPDHKLNEGIIASQGLIIRNLPGSILHRVIQDRQAFRVKLVRDAKLAAIRYFRQRHFCTAGHLFISPLVSFLQEYIFKLGFLDGKTGYFCARMSAWYTYLKYDGLRKLYRQLKHYPETPEYAK